MNRRKDFYIEIDDEDNNDSSSYSSDSYSIESERRLSNKNYSYSDIKRKLNNSKKKSNSSKLNKKQKVKRHAKVQMPKNTKIYIIILLIVILYFTYNNIILFFLNLLNSNPQLYAMYLYMESQIQNNTFPGLFFMSFLGSLFFLSLPAEILYIYYLSNVDKSFLILLTIMVIGNTVGFVFNYLCGFIVGERILSMIFKKSYFKYKNFIDKYGGYFLFFGNILPGPVELLSIFYGGFRYSFKNYIYLCFMGRLVKFIIITIAYFMFWDQLLTYYELVIQNLMVLKDFYKL